MSRGILISIFRSFPCLIKGETEDAIEAGLVKELSASQGFSPDSPGIPYGDLMRGVQYHSAAYGWIQNVARGFARTFVSNLPKHVLFPYVNRTKNVSRETARLYNIHRLKPIAEVTTNDLEMLYFDTGIQVEGPCELRSSFKFNDTKPRVYYAQGGSGYFRSRFCKEIAVKMMESLHSTKELHRRRPTEYLNRGWLDWDEPYTLMYWDLTSFTTRLGDLRFFLHSLISEIRRMGDTKISIWERTGVSRASLCDILDEYNHSMCYHPEFSFERFIHTAEDVTTTLMSRKGGLLGVPGNIGFSTALHGFVSEMISGQGQSVCVGDDAAAVGLPEYKQNSLVEHIQKIGLIPSDKFGKITISNPRGRFLKRGLTIDQENGLILHEFLPSLPHIADILGINIPDRTQDLEVPYFRAKKMVHAIARVLWEMFRYHDEVMDADIHVFNKFALRAYQEFNLPPSGCFSGQCSIKESNGSLATIQFVVPPLPLNKYDPRLIDWVDFAMQNHSTRYIQIPRLSEHPMKIPIDAFGQVRCTGSPLLAFLEDHGLVTKTKDVEYVDLEVPSHHRRIRDFLTGNNRLRQVYLIDIHKPLSSLEVSYDQLVEYPPLSIQMMGEAMEY
jgi:hypothetical protein